MANCVISEEHILLSDIPQGTVLASIFFIIMIPDIDQYIENSISRSFANETKVSAKIKSQDDTEHLQQDINKTYTWTDEKHMEFSESKFEQKTQSDTKNVGKGKYKTKSGQIIGENKTAKDLGILTSKDVSFADHLDDLVLPIYIKAGLLLRTFKIIEAESMMKMINSFVRSKLITAA